MYPRTLRRNIKYNFTKQTQVVILTFLWGSIRATCSWFYTMLCQHNDIYVDIMNSLCQHNNVMLKYMLTYHYVNIMLWCRHNAIKSLYISPYHCADMMLDRRKYVDIMRCLHICWHNDIISISWHYVDKMNSLNSLLVAQILLTHFP